MRWNHLLKFIKKYQVPSQGYRIFKILYIQVITVRARTSIVFPENGNFLECQNLSSFTNLFSNRSET